MDALGNLQPARLSLLGRSTKPLDRGICITALKDAPGFRQLAN
jgi:hypothetical protein